RSDWPHPGLHRRAPQLLRAAGAAVPAHVLLGRPVDLGLPGAPLRHGRQQRHQVLHAVHRRRVQLPAGR
ncbi:unnamed protein product, partial [Heterosigma akashiwo]